MKLRSHLLVLTFGVVVAAAAMRRGGASPGTLLRRWLTWSILAPLWWLATFAGPAAVAILVAVYSYPGGVIVAPLLSAFALILYRARLRRLRPRRGRRAGPDRRANVRRGVGRRPGAAAEAGLRLRPRGEDGPRLTPRCNRTRLAF